MKELISEFLEDLRKGKTYIIGKMVELSQTIGLKAEYYYPINDYLIILIKKWEEIERKKDCKKCDYWIEEYGCIHNHTDMYKCEEQDMFMESVDFYE